MKLLILSLAIGLPACTKEEAVTQVAPFIKANQKYKFGETLEVASPNHFLDGCRGTVIDAELIEGYNRYTLETQGCPRVKDKKKLPKTMFLYEDFARSVK